MTSGMRVKKDKRGTRWTAEEEKYIIDNYGEVTIKEIAKHLNRSYLVTNSKIQNMKQLGSIQVRNNARCKPGPKNKINWKEKDPFIIKNYKKMNWGEMAKKLGVKHSTLCNHIRIMREQGIIEKKPNGRRKMPEPNNVKRNIAELDGNVELGRTYHIKRLVPAGKNDVREFTGKLMQRTNRFYVFRNRNRAESFLKVDFAIGNYSIEEVIK